MGRNSSLLVLRTGARIVAHKFDKNFIFLFKSPKSQKVTKSQPKIAFSYSTQTGAISFTNPSNYNRIHALRGLPNKEVNPLWRKITLHTTRGKYKGSSSQLPTSPSVFAPGSHPIFHELRATFDKKWSSVGNLYFNIFFNTKKLANISSLYSKSIKYRKPHLPTKIQLQLFLDTTNWFPQKTENCIIFKIIFSLCKFLYLVVIKRNTS